MILSFKRSGLLCFTISSVLLIFVLFRFTTMSTLYKPGAFEFNTRTFDDGKMVTCLPIHPLTKQRLTFKSFIDLLIDGTHLAQQFKMELTHFLTEYEVDFFFECPPITTDGYIRDSTEFEFTLVRTDAFMNVNVDLNTFSQHFHATGSDIAVFSNLGGDAQLVSPKPIGSNPMIYAHFANFLRHGDNAQILSLWQAIGSEMKRILISSDAKVYLSTSGLGVSYLHVRLCKTSKYYQYSRYKNM